MSSTASQGGTRPGRQAKPKEGGTPPASSDVTFHVTKSENTVQNVTIRTPYGIDAQAHSDASAFRSIPRGDAGHASARQEFKDDVNINTIIGRWSVSQQMPVISAEPLIGAFEQVGSYQDMLNLTIAAQTAFNSLPGAVRKRFNNQPGEFMAFLHDPANQDEARALGLLKAAPAAPAIPPATEA